MSIFSLGWARNWKKYKYEMKKMNNEKIRNLESCLPINIVVKAMLDTLYFPGLEVNQY